MAHLSLRFFVNKIICQDVGFVEPTALLVFSPSNQAIVPYINNP
jgi:hypothetical protein